MDLEQLVNRYIDLGYSYEDANSKVCQDIILTKLFNSKYKRNVTIKGGVVMHNISKDRRRTTKDIDMDFVKYSLSEKSIKSFISNLNNNDDFITISIIGVIKELNQQDYNGKRVMIKIKDRNDYEIVSKIDLGVHKMFDIKQDEYFFDINGNSFNLLINSKEQIFTEKLKSLLKLGVRSTRYKDLFDFYYLINNCCLNSKELIKCFQLLIFNDITMKENSIHDIYSRLNRICNSSRYQRNLTNPKVNWLNITVEEAINSLLTYISSLFAINV